MKKYQELEAKIAELQQEVERLKKEEKNSLPENFKRSIVLEIVDSPLTRYNLLEHAFNWSSSHQRRHNYWSAINDGSQFMTKDDIIQLQKWVIISYQQQYENN